MVFKFRNINDINSTFNYWINKKCICKSHRVCTCLYALLIFFNYLKNCVSSKLYLMSKCRLLKVNHLLNFYSTLSRASSFCPSISQSFTDDVINNRFTPVTMILRFYSASTSSLYSNWYIPYCSFHISLSKAFGDTCNCFITCSFMVCVNVFLYNQEQNFSWIWQKMRNFPIDLLYNNRPLL